MNNGETTGGASRTGVDSVMSKVPQVTVFFWIIKVLCTTVGETFSDFFNEHLGLGLTNTSIAAGVLLALVLSLQFKVKRYIPSVYWFAVVLISIFGTLLTDILTDSLKFPLEYSTIIFSAALALTFAGWYATEKTLSIHSIFTVRRELFYWLAILFTFALGTATGDLYAERLGLGYLTTGLIVLGVIAAATAAWRLGLDAVLAFWIAYILTRPLGASLGDYLSQPRSAGGLGLGATVTSAGFLAAILGMVAYLAVTHRDFIIDRLEPGRTEKKGRVVVWQVVAVVALLLIVGGTGYQVRRDQLQKQAAAAVSPGRPLGNLTSFRQFTQEMLDRIHAGDMAGARAKAGDLERTWDEAQPVMQAMNSEKWTVMDNAIDRVLTSVRASSPSAAASGAALDSLIAVINGLENPDVPAAGETSDRGKVPSDAAVAGHDVPPSKIPISGSAGRPLGDLSSYKQVTREILDRVHAGDMAGARVKAGDLEKAWDDAQSVTQAMNSEKWTVMDDAIDEVLRSVRASSPSAAASGAALDSLLAVIKSLDGPK